MARLSLTPWLLAQDHHSGWRLESSVGAHGTIRPLYRGAFEAGDHPPKRVRVTSGRSMDGMTAVSRFLSNRDLAGRRSFGVSIEIAPESWEPEGNHKGWHFFSGDRLLLGIWSSLPATWLAQDADGVPLTPPWRELWTFGTDHLWACRMAESGAEAFKRTCLESNPEDLRLDVSWMMRE